MDELKQELANGGLENTGLNEENSTESHDDSERGNDVLRDVLNDAQPAIAVNKQVGGRFWQLLAKKLKIKPIVHLGHVIVIVSVRA